MNTTFIRLVGLLVVVVLTVTIAAQVENRDYGIGGGGGAGSCSVCIGYAQNNAMTVSCGSPDPGGWGHQNCRIESYPEATYCLVHGYDCCVD